MNYIAGLILLLFSKCCFCSVFFNSIDINKQNEPKSTQVTNDSQDRKAGDLFGFPLDINLINANADVASLLSSLMEKEPFNTLKEKYKYILPSDNIMMSVFINSEDEFFKSNTLTTSEYSLMLSEKNDLVGINSDMSFSFTGNYVFDNSNLVVSLQPKLSRYNIIDSSLYQFQLDNSNMYDLEGGESIIYPNMDVSFYLKLNDSEQIGLKITDMLEDSYAIKGYGFYHSFYKAKISYLYQNRSTIFKYSFKYANKGGLDSTQYNKHEDSYSIDSKSELFTSLYKTIGNDNSCGFDVYLKHLNQDYVDLGFGCNISNNKYQVNALMSSISKDKSNYFLNIKAAL